MYEVYTQQFRFGSWIWRIFKVGSRRGWKVDFKWQHLCSRWRRRVQNHIKVDWTRQKRAKSRIWAAVSSHSTGIIVAWLFAECRDQRTGCRKCFLFKASCGCYKVSYYCKRRYSGAVGKKNWNPRHCSSWGKSLVLLPPWKRNVETVGRWIFRRPKPYHTAYKMPKSGLQLS